MKPILEQIPKGDYSFSVKKMEVSYLNYPWHFHPEFELTLIEKSYGKRYVGDSIENFTDGDIALIGPNLNHYWQNDEWFHRQKKKNVKCTVIHFTKDSFGESFFNLPECRKILSVLNDSLQGVYVPDSTGVYARLINSIYEQKEIHRITGLLELFDRMAHDKKIRTLASQGYSSVTNGNDCERIKKIYEYTLQNITGELDLEKASSLLHLNPASFCRYFKSRMHKTYTEFVNEIRIGYACRLLQEKQMNITEICFSSGYNNLSYFNRQFHRYTGMCARDYNNMIHKNN